MASSDIDRHCFASDNYAGTVPEVWQALQKADAGLASPYGQDPWCDEACDRLRDLFDTDCDAYFVFNGTAANSLALATCLQPYHSVICHPYAHIETDECGAPEFFTNGSKLLLGTGDEGRLNPNAITELVERRTDIHHPRPGLVSITQSTELGTVYSPQEVHAIGAKAQQHQLRLHMDGARFAQAIASLDCHPGDCTWRVGVDVLCFGGTKQGIPVGEAVVFFDRALGEEFAWRCKQAGQLASKMRYLSAPWCALLRDDLWLTYAKHSNACARRLFEGLTALPGISAIADCQANEVFVDMPPAIRSGLLDRGWHFYTFIGVGGARFVCGWSCQHEWVDALVADAAALVQA